MVSNRPLTYKGVTKNLSTWCRELGILVSAMRYRLEKMSVSAAFELELDKGKAMLEKLVKQRDEVISYIDWFCNKRSHATCFVDGAFGMYWGDCAKLHDRRYENKRLTRVQADKLLFRCARRKSNIFIASIMWAGVRSIGWYYYDRA